MKNRFKINFTLAVFALVLIVGCTDNFDEINTDPNTLTTGQLDASFAGPAFGNAQYKGLHHGSFTGVGDDVGTFGLITMLHSMLFVQYEAAVPTSWATERNGINDGWRDRGWLRFYTIAVPALNIAYEAAEGNEEALAILDVWKVFMYHQMTDSWGPIPYTEAGSGASTIAYDSQEFIYNDFFELLESANSTLAASGNATVGIFETSDRIYSGDIEMWRKFANTLRLRLALRISEVDPAKAKTQAEAAVAAGVIETNAESGTFKVSEQTPNNFNQLSGFSGWGFRMSASMESILEGYGDPRLQKWFTPGPNTTEYIGQPSGGGTIRSWDNDDIAATSTEFFGNDKRATKNIEIIMASESFLNRAEGVLKGWNMGGGTARSYYEQGIQLSMQQWGITDASAVSAYLAGTSTPSQPNLVAEYANVGLSTTPPVSVPVAWASSTEDQLEQIAVQKYLALFPESWETWSDLRRSNADILYPLLNTENTDANVGRGLMKRLTYLPNEYSTNTEAVNAAVSTLGGQDVGGTLVWWDVD